jgi:RHS repeat-associated protein
VYGRATTSIGQINNTTGTVSYLHHDQQGSTRLLTGSVGAVTGKCTYGAYGTSTCEGATTTPLGYDAQYTSSDTGLIYLRGRTYDPTTAQFLSVDPLVKITGAPYVYAGDNPTTQVDPIGLESVCEIYNGILSPEPGTHIESKTEKQEQERGEKAETRELEKDALEERALNNKLAKELAEIRARGQRALEADKHSEEPIREDLKAVGKFGLSPAGGAVTGCLTLGAATIETGPFALGGGVVGAGIGYEGGDTAGTEPAPPLPPA